MARDDGPSNPRSRDPGGGRVSDDEESGAMVMVSVRVSAAWLDRADKLAARLGRGDVLGRPVNRTDVLRAALGAGLDMLERRAKRQ